VTIQEKTTWFQSQGAIQVVIQTTEAKELERERLMAEWRAASADTRQFPDLPEQLTTNYLVTRSGNAARIRESDAPQIDAYLFDGEPSFRELEALIAGDSGDA
jgi:hypothetical protein